MSKLTNFVDILLFQASQGNDFSGDEIQELAIECGILLEETRDKPCDGFCRCEDNGANFPTQCYVKNY